MKNKLVNLIVVSLIVCSSFVARGQAQQEPKGTSVYQKNFLGDWENKQGSKMKILKLGSLTIVAFQPLTENEEDYVVVSENGNKIVISKGMGEASLFMTDNEKYIIYDGKMWAKKS